MKYLITLFTITIFAFVVACSSSADVGLSSVVSPLGTGSGGSLARFTINGSVLYTVDNTNLNVFDIVDVYEPTLNRTIHIGQAIETIFSRDNTLFIGSELGMFIYDVSNRLVPSHLSTYQHIQSCDPVVADGQYAYVTLRASEEWGRCNRGVNELQVINISDLRSPLLENRYNMNFPLGLGVTDTLLFVCDQGLSVFSTSNVPELQYLQTFNIDANDVITANDLLIITATDGLYQYSYANDTIQYLSYIPVAR